MSTANGHIINFQYPHARTLIAQPSTVPILLTHTVLVAHICRPLDSTFPPPPLGLHPLPTNLLRKYRSATITLSIHYLLHCTFQRSTSLHIPILPYLRLLPHLNSPSHPSHPASYHNLALKLTTRLRISILTFPVPAPSPSS